MHLPTVTKQRVIILISIAGMVVLMGGYLATKPQRDAKHLIQILQQVQVGHTRIEELAQTLRGAGVSATSKGGNCQKDLSSPFAPKSLRPPVSNGGSSLSGGLESKCNYQLVVINKLLHGLRLAPIAGVVADIGTSGGTVDALLVFSTIGENGEIAAVNFSQVEGQVTWCGRDICVRRWNQSDGAPMRIAIAVSPDASLVERNRLLRLNTSCLSKIGGCKDARELLPISDDQ